MIVEVKCRAGKDQQKNPWYSIGFLNADKLSEAVTRLGFGRRFVTYIKTPFDAHASFYCTEHDKE